MMILVLKTHFTKKTLNTTASVVFYYKKCINNHKRKEKNEVALSLIKVKNLFQYWHETWNGKGNCNRNSNICNAIYRKYQKWSPRFMLYNLNPVCTTKFLIKFTGMYKDDKQVRIFCLIILKKVNWSHPVYNYIY